MSVSGAAEKRVHAFAKGLDFSSVLYQGFHACHDELTRGLDLLVSAIHALLGGVHALFSSIHATIEASLSLLAMLSRSFQNGPDLVKLTPDFTIHSTEV